MKLKRFLGIALASMLVIATAGCSSGGSASTGGSSSGGAASGGDKKSNVKIKIANIYGADTYESQSLVKFKELVESKSDNITVEVYTNGQLGNEETLTDSVRQGSVEMVVVGPMVAQYVPLIACSEYPFLVENWEEANAVLKSEVFEDMTTKGIEEQGMTFLGYNPVGFRAISSSHSITSMEDLKGMRIRTPNIPYYIKMAECWNANVIAMSLSELFTGLEQKVVDGQENPMTVVIANKFYEVQPYVLVSRHMLCTHGWYANSKFIDGLSAEDRAIVEECAKEAIDYCWQITEEGEAGEADYLREQGVTVTEISPEMYKQLKDSQGPMTEWFLETYPGADEVLKAVDEIKASL